VPVAASLWARSHSWCEKIPGLAEDAVVDVGDVADEFDAVAQFFEPSDQQVVGQVGVGVPQMGRVVGCDAADIDRHFFARLEGDRRVARCVVEKHPRNGSAHVRLLGVAERSDPVVEVEEQRYLPRDIGDGGLAEERQPLIGRADERIVEVPASSREPDYRPRQPTCCLVGLLFLVPGLLMPLCWKVSIPITEAPTHHTDRFVIVTPAVARSVRAAAVVS